MPREIQDLVVTKRLEQRLDKYKSLSPHVSAAILLADKGRMMTEGEDIEYIFTNSRHTNPLYRVAPRALVEGNGDFNYDKEKYRDMLLEAAETVLSIFGFDRTAYGDSPKKYKIYVYHKCSPSCCCSTINRSIENNRNTRIVCKFCFCPCRRISYYYFIWCV